MAPDAAGAGDGMDVDDDETPPDSKSDSESWPDGTSESSDIVAPHIRKNRHNRSTGMYASAQRGSAQDGHPWRYIQGLAGAGVLGLTAVSGVKSSAY